MTAPNWARTVKMLKRLHSILVSHDYEVREPDNLETPPSMRNGVVNPPVREL